MYWHRKRPEAREFVANALRLISEGTHDSTQHLARCVGVAASSSLMLPEAVSDLEGALQFENPSKPALFYLSLSAYSLKRYNLAAVLLDQIVTDDNNLNAYAMMLRGWLSAARGDISEQIVYCIHALDALRTAPEPDLNLRAMALRVLSTLARDRMDETAFAAAFNFDDDWWTDDLQVEHFQVMRMVAWYRAMSGEYIRAGAILSDARRLAGSALLRALAHLDRAWLAAISREPVHAIVELREADHHIRQLDLTAATDDEVGILFLAVELLAPFDRKRAAELLSVARSISIPGTNGFAHDERLRSFELSAAAAVAKASSVVKEAESCLREALTLYSRFEYKWRAANAALSLFEVTQQGAFLKVVADAAVAYPRSFIAAEYDRIQSVETPFAKLTGRQREIVELIKDEGLSNDGIAVRLRLSPNTVRIHKQRIFRAFRVSNEYQLLSKLQSLAR